MDRFDRTCMLRQALGAGTLAVALALAACGGGGGGGEVTAPTATTSAPTTPTPVLKDSFGRTVAADTGFQANDAGMDGTAAIGAALANAEVTVTDAGGRTVAASTDAEGYYRVRVTGFAPPLLVSVRSGARNYRGATLAAPRPGEFLTLNVSQLTDKMVGDAVRASGAADASAVTPAIVQQHAAAMQRALRDLREQFATVIAAAGLDATSFDPAAVPFRPDNQGIDQVLDALEVHGGSDGGTHVSTVLRTGLWEQFVSSLPGIPVAATRVPSAAQLIDGSAASLSRLSYPASTLAGNVITVASAESQFTVTVHALAFKDYRGCGTCGIGSEVTFTLEAKLEQRGMSGGRDITIPAPFDATARFRFVRRS